MIIVTYLKSLILATYHFLFNYICFLDFGRKTINHLKDRETERERASKKIYISIFLCIIKEGTNLVDRRGSSNVNNH